MNMTELNELWGLPIALALLAIAARLMLSPDRITFYGASRGLVLGVFVGVCANSWLLNSTFTHGERGAIVGICAILAEDLVYTLLILGKRLRRNPDKLLDILRRK